MTDRLRSEAAGRAMRVVVSFDGFYRDEYRGVAALAYSLTGSWPLAEDLAQEAFLRAHRRWDRVGTYDRPDAWVRRVVTNLAVSRFRRTAAEARALLRIGVVPVSPPPPDPIDERFWEEVRRLPRRQAQVVALHYVEDRSVSEIAGILEMAEGTVKSQLHRARATLAARLGDEARP